MINGPKIFGQRDTASLISIRVRERKRERAAGKRPYSWWLAGVRYLYAARTMHHPPPSRASTEVDGNFVESEEMERERNRKRERETERLEVHV